jgi:lipopolysaccharide assembly outer membrane protein LptD (OstA)
MLAPGIVFALAASMAFADAPGAGPSAKAHGSGIPSPVKAAHEEPISVTGQETIYDSKTDTFYVKGDAVMTQGGSVLKADEIDVMRRERKAHAIGHVHLIDPEIEMWATEANINITDETLDLYNAKVLAKQNTYHLEGKRITKLEGQHYQVKEGFFTTCACQKGAPDWSITADEMDVNVGTTGTAKNAKFDVLGHPIIPLPYAKFPADSSRHSGLLSGRYGQSSSRGFQWLQPYYLAINKSSDATFASDIETSQRIGGLAEYRLTNGTDDYLWGNGALYNESIRSDTNRQHDIVDPFIADPHIPVNRGGLIAMARQHITDNLIAYGDTISVSDSLYLREVNVWTLSRGYGNNFGSMRDAVSNFGLIDEFENAFVRLAGNWNQDNIQPQEFALQRLPDLTLTGRKELFDNLMFADYDAEAVNFFRYKGFDGWRFDINPRVTLPWRFGDYLTGYATVGSQGSVYSSSGQLLKITPVGTNTVTTFNNGVATNGLSSFTHGSAVPYFKTGVSTLLDRVYDTGWQSIEKIKNTIEPFANYAYVPRIFQGNRPLFDEFDRLNARSLITYGVTTRLYGKFNDEAQPEEPEDTDQLSDADSTIGPFREDPVAGENLAPPGASIVRGDTHSRELAQLTVQQAYDISHQVALDGSHVSDLEGILNVYPTKLAALSSQIDYNPRSHAGITYANVYLTFQPPWSEPKSRVYMGRALQGSFVQFGYNYTSSRNTVFQPSNRNGAQFMSARAYTDVFDRLGVYLAPNYDLAASKLLSAEYGVRLKSPCDCWAADFGITQSYNPNELQYQFQLTLGGLGSVGQSPFGRNPFTQSGLAGSTTGVIPRY